MRYEDHQEKASSHQPITPPANNNKSSGSLSCTSTAGSVLSPQSAIPTGASSPAASAHYQRMLDIQGMLKLGVYWIPAQKLAPILARIFFSLSRSNH